MGTITNTGYVVKSRADLKAAMEQKWRDAFGTGLDLSNAASPQNQIITYLVDLLEDIEYQRAMDFWARDIEKNSGIQLDIFGKEVGLPRNEASALQVTAALTSGVTGYIIPNATEFVDLATGTHRFKTKADIAVSSTPQNITLESEDLDFLDIDLTTKLQTVLNFTQIEDVEITAKVVGTAAESDESYRLRLLKRAKEMNAITRLQNYIDSLPGVKDCVIENNPLLSASASGVPGGAIEVRVLGGDNTAIATAIMDYTLAPTYQDAITGILVTVDDAAGYPKQYAICRPTNVAVASYTLTYTVKPSQQLTATDVAAIKDIISTHINQNKIGGTVYIDDIEAAILAVYKSKIYINTHQMVVDGTTYTEKYVGGVRSYLTVDTENISVSAAV